MRDVTINGWINTKLIRFVSEQANNIIKHCLYTTKTYKEFISSFDVHLKERDSEQCIRFDTGPGFLAFFRVVNILLQTYTEYKELCDSPKLTG